jgi:hypothetical protein
MGMAVATPAAAQDEESTACFSLHTSGAGATFLSICISSHGNVVKFESPSGYEQIGQANPLRDGYAVCSEAAGSGITTNHGFDAGGAEAGWGAAVIAQPNGANTFPLTITRTTLDGVFELRQSFARNAAEHELTITMRLKNVSAAPRSNVRLSRYFDNDVDNSSAVSRIARGSDSVWGWADGRHGFSLTAATLATSHFTQVETLANFSPLLAGPRTARGCFGILAATPAGPPATAYAGRNTYNLGSMNSGANKDVKFIYRRF